MGNARTVWFAEAKAKCNNAAQCQFTVAKAMFNCKDTAECAFTVAQAQFNAKDAWCQKDAKCGTAVGWCFKAGKEELECKAMLDHAAEMDKWEAADFNNAAAMLLWWPDACKDNYAECAAALANAACFNAEDCQAAVNAKCGKSGWEAPECKAALYGEFTEDYTAFAFLAWLETWEAKAAGNGCNGDPNCLAQFF